MHESRQNTPRIHYGGNQEELLNPQIFREYDIRGRVGVDLTPETVDRIARAYASYLSEHGVNQIVVGHDNRLSSAPFKQIAIRAFEESGCSVVDIGTVVTPIFYFSRVLYGIDGGMMITGSHNPPEDNGFKLTRGYGTIYGPDIQRIREIAEQSRFVSGSGSVEQRNPVDDYILDIVSKVRLGPRKLRVVVDCGNGTASLFAPRLLEELGCDVIRLYCESDGTFPNHHPDPVKKQNLKDLISLVLSTGADFGVSYDGDADRLGVVSDRGEIIWGDVLMALYWREILPKHPGTQAIIEVKCSQALVDEVERLGGKPFFYKTGHSLIKAKMKEVGAVFTGEMSGHMFFADEYYGYDDALYASSRLCRILSNSERTLSQMASEIPFYVSTPETRVDCPDEHKFRIVKEVTTRLKQVHEVIDIDGARVLAYGGWGLIRASNTQPVLVLRCEAKDEASLDRLKSLLEEQLARFPEVGAVAW